MAAEKEQVINVVDGFFLEGELVTFEVPVVGRQVTVSKSFVDECIEEFSDLSRNKRLEIVGWLMESFSYWASRDEIIDNYGDGDETGMFIDYGYGDETGMFVEDCTSLFAHELVFGDGEKWLRKTPEASRSN